jgi:tetratricopeptide (TPR) repeat protein
MAAQKPKDYSASIQLGRIALLSDRLDDAQKWLEKAITLQPGEVDPKVMLAEVYYRRDNFEKAAASLNGVDVSANPLIISQYPTLNLAKLQSFRGQTPYTVHGDGQSTHLKFLRTDPLPLVRVRVNATNVATVSATRCVTAPLKGQNMFQLLYSFVLWFFPRLWAPRPRWVSLRTWPLSPSNREPVAN